MRPLVFALLALALAAWCVGCTSRATNVTEPPVPSPCSTAVHGSVVLADSKEDGWYFGITRYTPGSVRSLHQWYGGRVTLDAATYGGLGYNFDGYEIRQEPAPNLDCYTRVEVSADVISQTQGLGATSTRVWLGNWTGRTTNDVFGSANFSSPASEGAQDTTHLTFAVDLAAHPEARTGRLYLTVAADVPCYLGDQTCSGAARLTVMNVKMIGRW